MNDDDDDDDEHATPIYLYLFSQYDTSPDIFNHNF